jgi:hypothetical protein
MQRTRTLLLGVLFALIALTSNQARAATSCLLVCIHQMNACINACNGNQTCVQNCKNVEADCGTSCN